MKVIHCIGRLKSGGAETQLNILVGGKSQELDNVVVSYDTAESDTTVYHTIDYNTSIFKKWKRFYTICKIERPDIIHIWLPAIFHVYAIPAFFLKTKRIAGVRNVYSLESPKRFLHFFLYILFRDVVSNSHLENHTGLFRKLFETKNYHFIPNAIKFDQDESNENEQNIKATPFKFLYVGRLVAQKNIATLLKALREMKLTNWNLTIVGKGQEKRNLENLVKELDLSKQVSFIDYTDNIKYHYQIADALVLPSFTEGMPNVAFEAAIFKKILVLSDIPQHRQWFSNEKNAFLFKPNSVNDLTLQLEKVMKLNVSQIEEINLEVSKILAGLTKDQYRANYVELYQKLLEDKIKS